MGRFGEELENALDRFAADLAVKQQIADDCVLVIVGIDGARLAAGHDDEVVGRAEPGLFGAQQSGRLAVFDFHQVAGVAPAGFAGSLGGRGIGGAQVFLIVALVVDDPADHPVDQRGVGSRLEGKPLLSLGGGLGEARVGHGDLQAARGDAVGDHLRIGRRTEIGLEGAGAEEEDVLGVHGVGLQMFLAAAPFAAFPLVGDLYRGDVMRLLADGRVLEPVDAAVAVYQPALGEFLAAVLDAPGLEDEFVVDRPQVGVLRIDEQVELAGVLGLEVG